MFKETVELFQMVACKFMLVGTETEPYINLDMRIMDIYKDQNTAFPCKEMLVYDGNTEYL